MTFHEVAYTTGSDEHDTPVEFFSGIAEAVNGFDLDPCAYRSSDLADRNIRLEGGLSKKWHGKVFMNTPYSEVGEWVKYAKHETAHQHAELVVGLVFARTGTQWFHRHAVKADLLCFVEGRLCFGDQDNSAPAPSMVAVWGDFPEKLEKVLRRKGLVVSP
jgi:hypothetical protein